MNVLYLTPWYPNRYDAMDGLFVRKHAQAVRRFADSVSVLYLKPVDSTDEVQTEDITLEGVNEITVYYHNKGNALLKFLAFFKAFVRGYKLLKNKPDIVQVNVLTRCGVLAYLLWKFKGIEYVVVEHWSRYHREGICFRNRLHKWTTQLVARNAKCVMPVSNHLAKAMQSQGLKAQEYEKINNVVDDFFFAGIETCPRQKKRIVHISCFCESAKNIKGILHATREVARQRDDFELVIVGTGADYDEVYNEYLQLQFTDGTVRFIGEQTPEEVSKWLKNSDFMVMFSNYENAPVVISEALAIGTPVISTNVGGIPEMIDGGSGILLAPKDEKALAEAMNRFLDNPNTFSKDHIKAMGEKYSFDAVGKHLLAIYRRIKSRNQ